MSSVRGTMEIKRILEGLPTKLQNSIIRGGVRAAAKEVAVIAREKAPRRYARYGGRLKKSVRYNTSRDRERNKVKGYVKAGGRGKEGRIKGAFYAHMVEYGTAPHVIKARKNPPGLFGKGIAQVQHPGAKKQPFMRPAMDASHGVALRAMHAYMKARFRKENINTVFLDSFEDLVP